MENNNFFDWVKSLINNKYLDNTNKLIEEKQNQVYEIYSNLQRQYLLYKFPDDGSIFPFFAKTEGLAELADYMLFTESNNEKYLLLIELKDYKQKVDHKKIKSQLDASECFFNYLNSSSKRIGQEKYNIQIKKIYCLPKRKRKPKEEDITYLGKIMHYNFTKEFRLENILSEHNIKNTHK